MARRVNPVRIADYVALLICASVLISLIPGFGEVLPYASILFYVIIPGYAFVRAFLSDGAQRFSDEKVLALIVFSVALSTFLKAITDVLLGSLAVPSVVILNFLSIIMLVSAIIRDRV